MFTIEAVTAKLGQSALIGTVNTVPKGHIRIETGFLYPDGSSIDVFIEQPDQATLDIHKPILSDFGTTWSWLQNFEMRPNRSPAQKIYFSTILENYKCRLNGAALECEIENNLDDLAVGIMRLGQACMRTADLIYSKRLKAQNNFNQDMEDVIGSITPSYVPDAEIPLRNGNIIRVDFSVRGQKAESAILTLSSAASSTAHTRANEINSRWDDLRELSDWMERGGQSITIFDDSQNVYDTKDLNRLERKSILLPASDTETLTKLLIAA
jgi:hypothetical protein